MFIGGKALLQKAREHHYALPAFNTSNLEASKALLEAAEETHSPLLIQTTESAINYAGLLNIFSIIKTLAQQAEVPVCIHLDHGKDLQLLKQCIALGYKSVMVDASALPFAKNVAIAKKVVRIAHAKKCSVEAELGSLGRIGAAQLTDPKQAGQFAEKTGCDALAVAIGTSHGAYKFAGKPKIDLKRLKEISKAVSIPLVLHGASSVDRQLVGKANSFGAELKHTAGVADRDIKKAIRLGVAKINIDTDIRLAFTAGIRAALAKNPADFDPRGYLLSAQQEVKQVAMQKIRLFGAKGKA